MTGPQAVRAGRASAPGGRRADRPDQGEAEVVPPATILEQLGVGVVVVDAAGFIGFVNSAAASLFGFPGEPELLRGRLLTSLSFETEDLAKVSTAARQARRGREWEGTLSLRLPDESAFFVRANSVPLRDAGGGLIGAVITVRQAVRLGGDSIADRIGLLERIGERLSGSLEVDETLRQVARTLVPQFADHCFIDLGPPGQPGKPLKLIRRAESHAGGWQPAPGTWAQPGDQISYPQGHFCYQAVYQQDAVLIEDIEPDDYPPAPTPESLREGLDVGITSVIASPLIARGQTLGVVSLGLSRLTEREGLRYGAGDRDFVAAIASRVAIAIDNAMLFEEERATALAFQTSLLPHEPPPLDGIEVAYRYVPAKPLESHGQGIQTQVGGDWYDIIQLSAGRVGIVIGDVMGRGAGAAALMGQLRSALRAFAQDDKAPSDILRRLDDWCRTLVSGGQADGGIAPDTPIVSCAYLVYDPWSRRLTIANAGHLPPLLITETGEVEQLELEFEGLMLGVRGKGIPAVTPYREETRELAPGSALVFYTDGLVDRRARADGEGLYEDAEVFEMLRTAIRSAARQSVREIAEAAEAAVPGQIDDDMAIVVFRTAAEELLSWEVSFAAEPIKVSEARRQANETFLSWGMDSEQADLACLLVSEVVTNVVLHTSSVARPRADFVVESEDLAALGSEFEDWGDSPFGSGFGAEPGQEFTLRLRKGTSSAWVEVFDTDLRLPRIRAAGENDEGGRGLYLVDQLADKWGSRPTEDGKAVWFEMPLRRPVL